ncbi:bifunctional folylpolyglutamate synthase/dihydrofolate synthase [Blattabacterium cuenoti]|uniref:bifunctional folylpolyglutamate synthase/dihydrofolate synthase n=1 Tax=Blattabacterium cuenoti TaxID=1653831 RepID=UPI00163BC671|nr:folylpolyglutamate synthase/dihydrofolate synthase family protein [Blattabacterium cuenoti]
MNYTETIQWIFNHLPFYQKNGIKDYKPGLERIKNFCSYLGNPQNFFKSIHIGGTNGKGSTTHMLSSILQEEKYNIGKYTSPHMIDYRERISFNGLLIEKDFIVSFISDNKKIIEKEKMTFFEMNTALAFQYFKEKKVNIAIIEVGMGGRLDSTNIINPEISIITNISLDHTESLGDNLLKIALEKSGIIKSNKSVIIGSQISEDVRSIFFKKALIKNSPIYFVKKMNNYSIYKIPFEADYQIYNKSVVLKTIDILQKRKNFFISSESIKNGLKKVILNPFFKGRWQIFKSENPKIILDIAHNEGGFFMIKKQLEKEYYEELHLVLGFVKGKKIEDILKLLPVNAFFYFCEPNIKRKLSIEKIKQLIQKLFINNNKKYFFSSVKEAFYSAKKKSKKGDLILITGSTFIVSEALF